MTANRDAETIFDIVDAARQIQTALQPLTLETFQAGREKQAAVLYFYIVIGEATRRISDDFRTQHPTVPWREMAGLRNIAAHQYDRIDLETIWSISQSRIPELIRLLEPLLPQP